MNLATLINPGLTEIVVGGGFQEQFRHAIDTDELTLIDGRLRMHETGELRVRRPLSFAVQEFTIHDVVSPSCRKRCSSDHRKIVIERLLDLPRRDVPEQELAGIVLLNDISGKRYVCRSSRHHMNPSVPPGPGFLKELQATSISWIGCFSPFAGSLFFS